MKAEQVSARYVTIAPTVRNDVHTRKFGTVVIMLYGVYLREG